MKKRSIRLILALLLTSAFLFLAACGSDDDGDTAAAEPEETQSRLELIRERGKVIVGVNAELPGFGYLSPGGEFEGFDVDFGRSFNRFCQTFQHPAVYRIQWKKLIYMADRGMIGLISNTL